VGRDVRAVRRRVRRGGPARAVGRAGREPVRARAVLRAAVPVQGGARAGLADVQRALREPRGVRARARAGRAVGGHVGRAGRVPAVGHGEPRVRRGAGRGARPGRGHRLGRDGAGRRPDGPVRAPRLVRRRAPRRHARRPRGFRGPARAAVPRPRAALRPGAGRGLGARQRRLATLPVGQLRGRHGRDADPHPARDARGGLRMTRLTFTGVVGHRRDDVWAWHERPGAVERLTPPWLPVRVRREAASLDHGEAVLGFPLGLRWVARHTGATPPERFVDELVSAPLRWGVRWRHTHELHDEGERTRVTDTLDTNVPEALVREMFAYRHRQLCLDLAAQSTARAAGDRPLVVAMTGSSGLVGGALAPFLTTAGHRVVRLVRGAPRGPDERRWDPGSPAEDLLRGVDAVIHLAGASIAGRFTDEHRAAVRDSRVGPTRALAELAGRTPDGPRVFVSASAIGFYGPQRGDEELTETSAVGDGFLAEVVTDWEDAAALAADAGLRVVTVRTGLVQSPRGGTLRLFRPLFAAGLGG